MPVNAEEAAKAYQERMSSGATKARYKAGIESTTVNPMEKAAQAEELYLARVEESVRSGRRRQKLLATPLARWKQNAAQVGAERLSSGAAKAMEKVRAHFQRWAPIYQSVSDTVNAMPKGGLSEAQARSAKAIEMLMQAAGRV